MNYPDLSTQLFPNLSQWEGLPVCWSGAYTIQDGLWIMESYVGLTDSSFVIIVGKHFLVIEYYFIFHTSYQSNPSLKITQQKNWNP